MARIYQNSKSLELGDRYSLVKVAISLP